MKHVVVYDRMQEGYAYDRVAPPGESFNPAFTPTLTPKEMLALGVFGGVYLRDCRDEYPADRFTHAKLAKGPKAPTLNYFGVDASLSLAHRREKGLLHPDDPRGWFQWYCRYYMGRRMQYEDARRIKRWKGIRRHVAAIVTHCGGRHPLPASSATSRPSLGV